MQFFQANPLQVASTAVAASTITQVLMWFISVLMEEGLSGAMCLHRASWLNARRPSGGRELPQLREESAGDPKQSAWRAAPARLKGNAPATIRRGVETAEQGLPNR